MWKKMEKLGIRKDRLQLEWVSAAEGVRFQQAMERMERLRQGVTPDEIADTQRILKEKKKTKKKKTKKKAAKAPA